MRSNRSLLILCLLVCGLCRTSSACNIPVFRYALERWQPDAAELVVFHDERLSRQHTAQIEAIRGGKDVPTEAHQASVRYVDVNAEGATDPLWRAISSDGAIPLPYVVVRLRVGKDRFINAWHGSVDSAVKSDLLDSPVRRELAQRLTAGESVVWLMLRSDDSEKCAAAKQALEAVCRKMEASVELPDGVGAPGSELYSEIPLLLRFTVLEINPQDPREQFLVQLFRGLRSDPASSEEPLFIPVFGRGRALEVIPADNLDDGLVEALTVFLCSACSCQVKEQNPGFDLPMKVAWDRELFGEEGARPPASPAVQRPAGSSPRRVPIPPGRRRTPTNRLPR